MTCLFCCRSSLWAGGALVALLAASCTSKTSSTTATGGATASGGASDSVGGALPGFGGAPSVGGTVASTGGSSGGGASTVVSSGTGGGGSQNGGAAQTGGQPGTGGVTTGTGGNSFTGGNTVPDAGQAGGSLAGTGGVNAGGAGGSSAGGSSGVGGGSDVPANFFMRYEAESPLNTLTYPVEGVTAGEGAPCAVDGVKEGANCASGGKVVNQILGRSPCDPPTSTSSYTNCQNKGGGVQFNAVTVPAAGNYDVTWWYHCGPDTPGHADVFGDTKCGGLNYNTGAGTGCRPHLIDVNGVPMSSTVGGQTALYYQFPCYTAPWSTLHGATTSLPLKAGANTILIHAPGATTLDAADIDALDVQPNGKGVAPDPLWPKLVTPVVSGS